MDRYNKKILIIDYGMGNLQSVANALTFLESNYYISSDKNDVANADAYILPGVGAFGEAMANLANLDLIDILEKEVLDNKKPLFGICLGMQLLAKNSQEGGFFEGLGWIDGSVVHIEVTDDLRIPHVGWNTISYRENEVMFNRVKQNSEFYFDHSYKFTCDEELIYAKCQYGGDVCAAIKKDNIFATQFHPEKSQVNGLFMLRNYLNYVDSK